MKLRLAYRIASMNPMAPIGAIERTGLNGNAIDFILCAVAEEAKLIPRVPQFTLDNVATFVAEHDRREWCPQDQLPNLAPPFPEFFAEFNSPKFHMVQGELVPLDVPEYQVGFLVQSQEVDEKRRCDKAFWDDVSTKFMISHLFQLDRFLSVQKECRWVIRCSKWMTTASKPISGSPYWTSNEMILFVSDAGKYITHAHTGFTAENDSSMAGELLILGLGISFCHCKNVRKVEQIADAGERFHRREKVPRIKFYTLDINPMREVLRKEGQSESLGIKKALHICRGHFATYSEDSPLFGKYVGTFWRPDHVRGSKEAGEVHKRYSVGGQS